MVEVVVVEEEVGKQPVVVDRPMDYPYGRLCGHGCRRLPIVSDNTRIGSDEIVRSLSQYARRSFLHSLRSSLSLRSLQLLNY